jgi:stage V sporulation protein R
MDYRLEDLQVWDEKITKLAKERNLDWYELDYEVVDYHEMIGAMVHHGMPSMYSHWSFGKSFEQTMNRYNLGAEGLPYELIINSNPSLAYLMRENPLYLQILIMAHCVGHSDFFKNNRMFKNTQPNLVIQKLRSAKKRIQGYVEDPNIGISVVEKVIDACQALQFQTTKYGQIRRPHSEMKADYVELMNNDKNGEYKNFNINFYPLEPDYDLLGFIEENADIPEWQRDIINVCRYEGQYFWPQIQTKIMNEGWASFWHYTLCHELDLPGDLHLPIIKMHNAVVRPHIGAINPYHLGFHLFQKIKERHGIEECFLAREVCYDVSFLRQYLTEEDCVDLNLFSYSSKKREGVTVDDVSDDIGWEQVKANLISNVAGGSIPVVYVDELKRDGMLIVKHEHDGRDLELKHANEVVEHIKHLWNGPVKFYTMIEEESWEID